MEKSQKNNRKLSTTHVLRAAAYGLVIGGLLRAGGEIYRGSLARSEPVTQYIAQVDTQRSALEEQIASIPSTGGQGRLAALDTQWDQLFSQRMHRYNIGQDGFIYALYGGIGLIACGRDLRRRGEHQ